MVVSGSKRCQGGRYMRSREGFFSRRRCGEWKRGKESFRLLLLLLLSMQLSGSLSPPQPSFCRGNLSQTWQTDFTSLRRECALVCACVCVVSVNCALARKGSKILCSWRMPLKASCQQLSRCGFVWCIFNNLSKRKFLLFLKRTAQHLWNPEELRWQVPVLSRK